MCEEHQREYWRVKAAETNAKKPPRPRHTAPPVKSVGQFTDGEPAPQAERVTMGEAEQMYMENGPSAQEPVNTAAAIESVERLTEVMTHLNAYQPHDCKDCYAKGVIEALRARSPKLAALIDAMEAQERAAHELGL